MKQKNIPSTFPLSLKIVPIVSIVFKKRKQKGVMFYNKK